MVNRSTLGFLLAGIGILTLAVAVIDDGNLALGGVGAFAGLIGIGVVSRASQRVRQETRQLGRALQSGSVQASKADVPELEELRQALSDTERRARLVLGERDAAVERLEQVLGVLVEGAMLVDGDDITYANPAATTILGQAVPSSLRSLTPYVFQRMVEACRRGEPADAIVETGSPNRTVAVNAVAVDERVVLLALRDVTDRARVDAIRRDFVADASHELKTPIAAIQSAAETVQVALPDDPDGAQRFVTQILQHSSRLGRIVSHLLDLSRLESKDIERSTFDLGLLVADEAGRLAKAAEARRLDLEMEFDVVDFEGSVSDVRLAVKNLVENAIRYTDPGGTVRVRIAQENGDALVVVSDTGLGIPARDIPRVFERFYRVDSARSRATGGTGLGLAIVRHVADRHGGSVEVQSELGAGSTFTMRLPIAG